MIAFVQNISPTQLIAILLIILLLFGAKRLPELARSFGKSIKEFKHATKDIEKDFRSAMDDVEPMPPVKKSAPAPRQDSNPPFANEQVTEDMATADSTAETKA
jgi:TatA/E family protein of Tat protein translocase